ncbi:MAG: hypothetical protein C0173_06705, partial [Desulfurella sp.]
MIIEDIIALLKELFFLLDGGYLFSNWTKAVMRFSCDTFGLEYISPNADSGDNIRVLVPNVVNT